MGRVLRAVGKSSSDESSNVVRALAEALPLLAAALVPHLQDHVDLGRREAEIIDIAKVVPLPKSLVYAACRRAEIEGATCLGRRWLATRGAVDAWLRDRGRGPRLVSQPDDDDDLEQVLRSLARPAKHSARAR